MATTINQRTLKTFCFIITPLISFFAQAQDYKTEVLNNELDTPWALAVLPDNSLFITERTGQLKYFSEGQLSEAISGVPQVYFAGQGGLLDVLPDADFSNNQRLFLSFASGTADNNYLEVVSAKWNKAKNALENAESIFKVTPGKDTPVHYGARMTLLPDNTLLVATGDGFDYRESAQLKSSLLGKIIRINLDGSAPGDNPFVAESDSDSVAKFIWSLGHRNPQSLFYDKESDTVFSHEHGPAGGDEINMIAPGTNYGWPVITNGKDYSGASISPFKTYPGMQQPHFDWTPSVAPSDMILYRGEVFPELDGQLLVTTLKNREVQILSVEGENITFNQSVLAGSNERYRAIEQDIQGNILLLTDSGKLLKLGTSK